MLQVVDHDEPADLARAPGDVVRRPARRVAHERGARQREAGAAAIGAAALMNRCAPVEPVAVGTHDRRIAGLAGAGCGRRTAAAPDRCRAARAASARNRSGRPASGTAPRQARGPACPGRTKKRHAIVQRPRRLVRADADRGGERGVAREAGVVIAEDDEHRVVEQAVARQRGLEVLERLIEEAHRVQVVAERGALERAELQHLVPVGKRVERMVQRQRDQPRGERPRHRFEPRHHLLQEIAVVQAPPDLLRQLEIGLEQALLKAVRRMHHAAVPEPRLERHGRQRGVRRARSGRAAGRRSGCRDSGTPPRRDRAAAATSAS